MAIVAAGEDETFVGRIREDESIANGLNMFIVESYMKDILENIEDIEDSYMARDVAQDEILNEIENAMNEREMQAIRIACRAGIICGINLCKNRGLNIPR